MGLGASRWLTAVLVTLALSGCAAVDYQIERWRLEIDDRLASQLASGQLVAARLDLERKRANGGKLSGDEQAVLCDIYVRHVSFEKARDCIDLMETAGIRPAEAISTKRALLYYLEGDYALAASWAARSDGDGARYIRALAMLARGAPQDANDLASKWERSEHPPRVLMAAALQTALAEDEPSRLERVIAVLEDPETRLAQDYAVTGHQGVFGGHLEPVPLRVDLAGEFRFGVFDSYSFAPRSNLEVEYLFAHAKAFTPGPGRDQAEALRRLDALISSGGSGAQAPRPSELGSRCEGIGDVTSARPVGDALWGYRDLAWRVHFDRGLLNLEAGRRDAARADFEAAACIIEAARATTTTDAARLGFAGDRHAPYAALTMMAVQDGNAEKAYQASARGRARSLVDLLASVEQIGPREGATREDVDEALERQALVDALRIEEVRASQYPNPLPPTDAVFRRMEDRYRRTRFRDLGYSVRIIGSVDPATLNEVRQRLGDGQALIAFDKLLDGWIGFVVTKGSRVRDYTIDTAEIERVLSECGVTAANESTIDLPRLDDPLERAVLVFRNDIRRYPTEIGLKMPGECAGLGQALYHALVEPAGLDAGAHSRLYIVPWGALYHLPFAALETDTAENLVDRHVLALLPTPDLLLVLSENPRATGRLLAFGYGDESETGRALANVNQEIDSILAAVSGTSVTGPRATEQRFMEMTAQREHSLIHIAGHAVFDENAPMSSYIRLAAGPERDENPENDGRLAVTDLFAIENQWDADLAVLSACNTGLGRAFGGDVVGLQRGLLYAGVLGIVGSLWPIEDGSAAAFMERFYVSLGEQRGRDPAQALRAAMCEMRAARGARADWAGFTYTGVMRSESSREIKDCPPPTVR